MFTILFKSKDINFVGRLLKPIYVNLNNKANIFTKPRIYQPLKMSPIGLTESYDMKLKPEELLARTEKLIEKIRSSYNAVGSVKTEDVNCDTVLKPLSDIIGEFTSTSAHLIFPKEVSTEKDLRDAATKANDMLNELEVEMSLNQDVFAKLFLLQEQNIDLDPQFKKFLTLYVKKGRRNALHLPREIQEKVKTLRNKINELSNRFCMNLGEVTTFIEFTDEQLDGLPADFISELEKSHDTGKRKVTLKYPHYFPVMGKAKIPETRKQMLFAFNTQCLEENIPILEELITLRHEHAQLLGYPTHAHYVTEVIHSKNPETVTNFLTSLAHKLRPLWEKERELMLKVKEDECKQRGVPFDGVINDFDLSYYMKQIEELDYNIDSEKVREYFALPAVKKALFQIYQKILGLTFKEIPNPNAWHPEVEMYSVEDATNGNLKGYFFLDLFPRDGKYGHAAIKPLQVRYVKDGTVNLPVLAMVANFTKSTETKPSLLKHSEVQTFFHEFGHVMHFICSNNDIATLNNLYEILTDFLELPSQILENWVWDEAILKIMSEHYKDHTPMPIDMMDSLIKTKVVNAGVSKLRQISLSMADQRIHSCGKADTKSVYYEACKEFTGILPLEGTNFMAHFSHLASFYDAKYYSYLWSEVFSMDMFDTRFKNGNTLNSDVGMEYRQKVLEVGYAEDVDEIIRSFLGREANDKAFLANLGVEI